MATIHKLTKNGATIFPATITDAVVHPQTGKTLTSMIKEYNVSELFPSEGIDGGNQYNLALAIQVLGSHLTNAQKTGGIKLTFISSVLPHPTEEYYLHKNVWSGNVEDWNQRFEVGDVIADPSGSWRQSTAQQYIDQQIATVTNNLALETIGRQIGDNNLRNQLQSEMATRADQDTNLNALINAGIRQGGGVEFDIVPTQNSANGMTSGGMYSTLRDSNIGFVDEEPILESNNLVKSGGVASVSGSYGDGTYSFENYLDTNEVLIETLNTDGDRISERNNFEEEYNVIVTKNSTALFKTTEGIRHTGLCCHITGASSITHDYDYRSQVANALKDVGAEFVRCDFPINDSEITVTKLDNALYQLSRNNLKPLAVLSFERDLNIKETVLSLIDVAVRKYNGVTDITPTDAGGATVHINIDYWELLNEVDNININIIAEYTRAIYECIKSIDQNKKVVMTSLSSIARPKLSEILNYRFNDGHYLTEFFDILNVHLYGDYSIVKYQLKNLYKALIHRKETIGEKSVDKPIWITETGASLYNYTEAKQAVLLVTRLLTYRSMGADIVFPFQLRSSCNSFGRNTLPIELYYGILKDCIVNSYISLFNENNEPLSEGDGYKKYTIHSEEENVYLGTYEINNLKSNGLKISGNNFHLISVKHIRNGNVLSTLFTGDSVIDSGHSVHIGSSAFSGVAAGDYLRFEINNANVSNEWASIQQNLAYPAIKYLHSIIGKNVPTLEFFNKDIIGISIISDNDTPIFVLINNSSFSYRIHVNTSEINWIVYDINGYILEQDIHDFIVEPLTIIYISNIKKFNIKINQL